MRHSYSQTDISIQLKYYLDAIGMSEGKKRQVILNFSGFDYQGDCNGYSFLFGYYYNAHRAKEFNDTLSYIKNWDGNLRSLNSKFDIPDSLKKMYSNGKELFEQTINDIVWFSHITRPVMNIQPKLTYWDRIGQWQIATDEKHKLNKLFSFDYDNVYNKINGRSDMAVAFSNSNLPETLKIFANWKDSWLDITVENWRGAHEVSVYISSNGTYTFYDPNNGHLPYESASPYEVGRNIFDALGQNSFVRELRGFKILPSDQKMFDENMIGNSKTLFSHQNSLAIETLLKLASDTYQYDLFYKIFNNLDGDVRPLVSKFGHPALSASVDTGNYDLAKLMLEHKVDVNLPAGINPNCIDSPLIDCVKKADFDMASLLIQYGADVNQKGSMGKTPLMYAAESGNEPLFSLLLNNGANINTKDAFGNNAKSLAHNGLHSEIISVINKIELSVVNEVPAKNEQGTVISMKDVFSASNNVDNIIGSQVNPLPPPIATQLIQEMMNLSIDSCTA